MDTFDTSYILDVVDQSTHLTHVLDTYNNGQSLLNYFKEHHIDIFSFELLFRYRDTLLTLDVPLPEVETLDTDTSITENFVKSLEHRLINYKEYLDKQYDKLFNLISKANDNIPNKAMHIDNQLGKGILSTIRSVTLVEFNKIKNDPTFPDRSNVLDYFIYNVRSFLQKSI